MATQKEINLICQLLEENRPPHPHKTNRVEESRMGIGAVMKLLEKSNETVTAGMIAEDVKISTARVAVLLKKMESKGLIIRQKDSKDARITNVVLTDKGKEHISKMKNHLEMEVGKAIDKIGMQRLLDFIEVAKELREILPKQSDDFPKN